MYHSITIPNTANSDNQAQQSFTCAGAEDSKQYKIQYSHVNQLTRMITSLFTTSFSTHILQVST